MKRGFFLKSLFVALLAVMFSAASGSGRLSVHSGKTTIRVMTFNIHVGVGMDKKLDLKRIAEVIKSEHPDLVGLQEVDRGVRRTEGKDEIAELAKLTLMDFAFAHNLDFQGGDYGIAILSRTLIQNREHQMFENRNEAERRGMLRVEVEVNGKTVNFVTTHLDYQDKDNRLFELEQMLKFLAGVRGPVIVAGDFNDEPSSGVYALMSKDFDDVWIGSRANGHGLSYPADKPVKRIDYIFARKSDGLHAKKAWVVNSVASDHVPVVAEIELR